MKWRHIENRGWKAWAWLRMKLGYPAYLHSGWCSRHLIPRRHKVSVESGHEWMGMHLCPKGAYDFRGREYPTEWPKPSTVQELLSGRL